MVRGLTAPEFILEEDGVRQTPGHGGPGDNPHHFCAARGQQPEHVAEHGLRPGRSGQPDGLPAAEGPGAGGPVLAPLRAVTGPTNDGQTIS